MIIPKVYITAAYVWSAAERNIEPVGLFSKTTNNRCQNMLGNFRKYLMRLEGSLQCSQTRCFHNPGFLDPGIAVYLGRALNNIFCQFYQVVPACIFIHITGDVRQRFTNLFRIEISLRDKLCGSCGMHCSTLTITL